ncbi:MAG: hypothetical protein ACK5GV_11400 [Bacteroidota bacterium]
MAGNETPKLFNIVKDATNAAGILLNSILLAEVVFETCMVYELVPFDRITVDGTFTGVTVSKNSITLTGPGAAMVIGVVSPPATKPFIMAAEIGVFEVGAATSVVVEPPGNSIGIRVSPGAGVGMSVYSNSSNRVCNSFTFVFNS